MPVVPFPSDSRGDTALTSGCDAVKAHKGIKASRSTSQRSCEAVGHKATSPVDACAVFRRRVSEGKNRRSQPLRGHCTFWWFLPNHVLGRLMLLTGSLELMFIKIQNLILSSCSGEHDRFPHYDLYVTDIRLQAIQQQIQKAQIKVCMCACVCGRVLLWAHTGLDPEIQLSLDLNLCHSLASGSCEHRCAHLYRSC